MLRSVLVLGLLGAANSVFAADTLQRCQAADGTMVYTDTPCEQLDARPLTPPRTKQAAAPGDASIQQRQAASPVGRGGALSLGGSARDDCIRRTDILLFEIRSAIQSRNVNRLAGVYDWAGKSAGAAGDIIERLARLAEQPLATVELHYPQPAFDAGTLAEAEPPDARPDGVRILQQAPGEIEPRFAVDLRLVRNADCWWVSF